MIEKLKNLTRIMDIALVCGYDIVKIEKTLGESSSNRKT